MSDRPWHWALSGDPPRGVLIGVQTGGLRATVRAFYGANQG